MRSDKLDVLVVDDEPSFSSLVKKYLEMEDERLEVDVVNSPEKAVNLFCDYDCVVSDYQMPGMDGLELLKKVRKEWESDIPFIMFTGKGREEVAMDALNHGADRYLQKGGDPKTQFHELAHTIIKTSRERFVEKKLEREKKRAKKYFETAQVMMVVIDSEGLVVDANQKACDILGYPREELVGKDWIENFVPNRYREMARESHKKFLETGEKDFLEQSPVITRGGDEKIISWHNSVIENEDGEPIASLNSGIDVTQSIEREREIQEKKWMLEGMLNGVTDMICFQKPDHTTIKVNRPGTKLLDTNQSEVAGSKCYELVGKQRPCIDCPVEKAVETKERQRVERYFSEIGKHLEVIATPIMNERGDVEFVVEQVRDLTEIKELAKKHRLIKYSVDQASIEVYWLDPEGRIRYANEQVRRKLGYSHEELRNMYVWDVDPEYTEEWRTRNWREMKESGSVTFESSHQTSDGETYPVEITSHYVKHEGREFELAFAKDITERKEKQQREKFLHRLLRHDIANKSQVIQGYIELIEKNQITQKDREILNKIMKAAEEQKNIINKVRTLRKIKKEETKPINIKNPIKSAVEENIVQANQKNIKIKYKERDIEAIAGELLREVINNLIQNAIQHAEPNQIEIKTQETPEKTKIKIEDDGKGIPKEKKKKIFEKGIKSGENAGSGLGLYLAKEITSSYGGEIECSSSQGEGTEFTIKLENPG